MHAITQPAFIVLLRMTVPKAKHKTLAFSFHLFECNQMKAHTLHLNFQMVSNFSIPILLLPRVDYEKMS